MKSSDLVIWMFCCIVLSGVTMDLELKYFSISLIVISIILLTICLVKWLDGDVKFQDVDKERSNKEL